MLWLNHIWDWHYLSVSLQFSLQRCDFGLQRLLELLLLLQVPEDLAADALQALHLPLALVHLPLQGLHAQRQLGTERERERQGVRGDTEEVTGEVVRSRGEEAGQAGVKCGVDGGMEEEVSYGQWKRKKAEAAESWWGRGGEGGSGSALVTESGWEWVRRSTDEISRM